MDGVDIPLKHLETLQVPHSASLRTLGKGSCLEPSALKRHWVKPQPQILQYHCAKVGQTTALQRREKRLGGHTLGVAQWLNDDNDATIL